MAAPPPGPGTAPPQGPPPAYPGYAPPYAPYPPQYPPPAPRKDNTLPILIVVLVVVFVVIPAIIAIWFFMFLTPLVPNLGPPTVTFSAVSQPQGNATFTIATISQTTIAGFFRVNMRVDGVLGSGSETLDESGATISVGGTTYIVFWEDLGNPAYVSVGDGFRVTGDGTPLPAGSYELYLLWYLDERTVATATWTV
jgi:hypothetical protein